MTRFHLNHPGGGNKATQISMEERGKRRQNIIKCVYVLQVEALLKLFNGFSLEDSAPTPTVYFPHQQLFFLLK